MTSSGSGRIAVIVALLAIAFASNPDEKSFAKYVDQSMKTEGASWLERKVTSHVTALVHSRRDFKFFSLVNVPEVECSYIGIFGQWIPLPAIFTKLY